MKNAVTMSSSFIEYLKSRLSKLLAAIRKIFNKKQGEHSVSLTKESTMNKRDSVMKSQGITLKSKRGKKSSEVIMHSRPYNNRRKPMRFYPANEE